MSEKRDERDAALLLRTAERQKTNTSTAVQIEIEANRIGGGGADLTSSRAGVFAIVHGEGERGVRSGGTAPKWDLRPRVLLEAAMAAATTAMGWRHMSQELRHGARGEI